MSSIEEGLLRETDSGFSRDRQGETEGQRKDFDSGTKPRSLPNLEVEWDVSGKYVAHVRSLLSNVVKNKSRYREELEELELMGEGSFGKVFKCRGKTDGKLYAVKQVLLTAMDTESEDTRTLTTSRDKASEEPQGESPSSDDDGSSSHSHHKALVNGRKLMESFTMSQLDHPNVVRFYASWIEKLPSATPKAGRNGADKPPPHGPETSGTLYLQMEICECHSLKRWLSQRDKDGKLDPTQNIAIFAQIVHGLHYIHKNGYFHRDIKPANVLLNPSISSPAFLVAHPHHRRKSTSGQVVNPYVRTRSPAPSSGLSSRAVGCSPPSPRRSVHPPPLNRVSSLPSSKQKLLISQPRSPLPSGFTRGRADSGAEKGLCPDDDFTLTTISSSPPMSESSLISTEADKEIPFDSSQAYKMANYIAKIGDFGLATKVRLGKNDSEEPAKDSPKNSLSSPTNSPPPEQNEHSTEFFQIHFNSGAIPRDESKSAKRKNSTPKVSPLPTPFTSENPEPVSTTVTCAHKHGTDGEPRPCRRAGLRTCGIGTTLYAAPEQLYSHYYDAKVDIFSLGLILVEMYSTAEGRKDRYKTLKKARKGLLPPSLAQNYPQEAELISRMLQLSPADRPSTSEILRHPLLQYFQPGASRCSTPILRRSNSLLALPSPIPRSRSGRAGIGDRSEGPSNGRRALSPRAFFAGGFESEHMDKFVRTRRPSLPPPDLASSLSLSVSPSASFSFGVPGADESRKTTPVSSSSPHVCTCSDQMEKLQNMVKEQKNMMDQMAQKLHSYEEQMKAKEIGMQTLRESVQQLQLLCEKMQSQLLGRRK